MTKDAEWFEDQTQEIKDVYPKFTNKYTGEIMPFRTVSNVQPDKGVENTGKDLCRKEDFEPIGSVIARFLRSGGVENVMQNEYAYSSDNLKDLSEDDAFDYVDQESDVLDQAVDMDEYMDNRTASFASGSAVGQEANASEERVQQSDEQADAPSAEKPSE